MADEIEIEGVTYVSSKRASQMSGYAQDYIGQLARGGYIDARRIGGLWHVSFASLQEYEKKAVSAKSQQVAPKPTVDADSLISFDGKDYVSASRAAHITGYHQDYVGQLARSGTVISRQVGNRWYVDREAILAHKAEKDRLLGAVQSQSVGIGRVLEPTVGKNIGDPSGESPSYFTYTKDEASLLPETPSGSIDKESQIYTSREPHREAHAIPIRVNREPTSHDTLQHDTDEHSTRELKHSSGRPMFYGVSIAVVLVVLVGLFFSLPLIKGAPVSSLLAGGEGDGGNSSGLGANAAGAFVAVGDVLEKLLVPELIYVRDPQ